MDRLLERQEAIQKKLVNKHLNDGWLVLYDITRSYFEGKDRRWTVQDAVERLNQVCRNGVPADGIRFHQVTELDDE